jgi:hypothetical protein
VVALALADPALGATAVTFVLAQRGETLTVLNPQSGVVTGQIRLISDAGSRATASPLPFSLSGQEAKPFPNVAGNFGLVDSPSILAVESSDAVKVSSVILRIGYPEWHLTLPVRFNPNTPTIGSLVLGILAGLVRVNIYEHPSSATPIVSRTFGSSGEQVTRLRYMDLIPATMAISDGYAEVIPLTGQVVGATLNPPTRRRAAGTVPTVPPNLSITGGLACEFASGVHASVPAVSGASYQWTIRNGSAPVLTGNSVDVQPFAAGTLTAELAMTINGVPSFAGVNVVVIAKPSIQSLAVSDAVLGQQAVVRWNATGAESARLYGTDFPSGGEVVTVATGEYRYSASSAGLKSAQLALENGCGSASANTAYRVTPACSTPSASITAPSSVAPNASFSASMPSGASSYSWSVAGGTITSGQGMPTVTITAGSAGVVSINSTASNGGGCEDTSVLNVAIVIPAPIITNFTAPSTLEWATGGSVSFTLQNAESWSITTSSTSQGWNTLFANDENYFGDPSQGPQGSVSWTGASTCAPQSNCTPKVSGAITLSFVPYLPNNDAIILTAAGPGGTTTRSVPIKIPGGDCLGLQFASVVPVGGSATWKVRWVTSDASTLVPSSSLGNTFTPVNIPIPEGLGTYSFLYTRSVAGDDHVGLLGPGCQLVGIVK